jgi:hypothetical protein
MRMRDRITVLAFALGIVAFIMGVAFAAGYLLARALF